MPENFTANENNITFSWNTDGVALFNSSKLSAWPFYLVINELPSELRFNKENMLLVGLWCGQTKPNVDVFVSSFKEDLKQLYRDVDFCIPDRNPVNVMGMIICGTCDFPAKALFLNFQQYNGKHGCPNCEIETQRKNRTQVYPYEKNLTIRTTEQTKFMPDKLVLINLLKE